MAREDLSDFIESEMRRLGFVVEGMNSSSSWLKTRCVNPQHNDSTPSFSINRYTGYFQCFGCGISGKQWNDLSQWIPVKEISEDDDDLQIDPFRVLRRKREEKKRRESVIFTIPWDADPWKGPWQLPNTDFKISQQTLQALDARRYYDDRDNCYRILFPCWQQEELYGWTARRLDDAEFKKKDQKPPRRWRNCDNFRAIDVLFPLDIVMRMHSRYVVLVEGPGDAIRLVNYDIPALAILGTKNWNPRLGLVLLHYIGAEVVILALDSDDAGRMARARIELDLQDHFAVKNFRPPEGHDPASMPLRDVRRLWKGTRR